MRKIAIVVILICLLLTGCQRKEPYTFRQDFEQIKTIEIVKKVDASGWIDELEIVKVMDPSEFREVIDALLEIKGTPFVAPPDYGFGYYIFRITYQDGEVELIGYTNNGYISEDGELHLDTYHFNREQFYDIISRFLGETVTEPTRG